MAETKKKPPVGKPLPEGMVGTREAAAKLKIEPRELRVWLRSKKRGTGGERYAWTPAELAKLAAEFKADAEKSQATAGQ